MQKTMYSIALLTPTLLMAGGFDQAARAQGTPQNLRTQQIYTSLRGSVCRNDWNRALRETSLLIGAPEVSSAYRQRLVHLRHRLEDWRASRAVVENIPDCRGVATLPLSPPESNQPIEWNSYTLNG